MKNTSVNRSSFGKKIFKILLTVVIVILLFTIGFVGGFAAETENFSFDMLLTSDFWVDIYENAMSQLKDVLGIEEDIHFHTNSAVEKAEEISFEGVKLSEVTKLEMLKYIDFTVPYNWTFGKVDVENPSTEEAIAITNNDAVLMVSLRNIEMASDKESILWAEEALLFELKEKYPDFLFTKPELFENEVAFIDGTLTEKNAKLYIAIIPLEDKTVYVNYTFKEDDWLADLYFNTVINEMLNSK